MGALGNIISVAIADSGALNYMPRRGWGAASPKAPIPHLKRPVKMVAVFHTAFVKDQCRATENCCDIVKDMQTAAMSGILCICNNVSAF